jgi:hypothetical protein
MFGSKRLAVVLLATLVLSALLACKKGKKEQTGSTTTPTTAAAEIGIPECDEFLQKYDKCVSEKVPEAARQTLKQSIEQMRSAWKQAAANPLAKPALASGCKQAAANTQAATASYGCEW